jgi:hypothetical protein
MIAHHYWLALSRMMCIECIMAKGCMCCHINQAPFHPTETHSLISTLSNLARIMGAALCRTGEHVEYRNSGSAGILFSSTEHSVSKQETPLTVTIHL